MFFLKKNRKKDPFDMDDILLDATNLPHFDTQQFEGRIEHPISARTIFTVFILFVLVLGGFLFRAWNLQIVEGGDWRRHSENNRLDNVLEFAQRGNIYDRNGIPLAWNGGEISTSTPFVGRMYTEKEGFGHILGYLNYPRVDSSGNYYKTEYEGVGGVESIYNAELAGSNGTRIIEENAHNEIVSDALIEPAEDGGDLYLSIDARIQEKLYEEIQSLAEDVGFHGGAGVILDIRSGEVIALASYPDIDSQILTDGKDTARIATFITDEKKYFLNRVIAGLYTPGSIVKPFVATAALEEKVITPEKKILSTGSINIPNPYDPTKKTVFNDWKAHGWVDIRDALAVSSNIYFFEVGGGYEDQKGVGIQALNEYFSLFGVGEKTGIDLPGEVDGNIPNPDWKAQVFPDDPWRIGDTYNTAIGQYGFQVSPIQMVHSIGALANGGLLVQPHIAIENAHTEARQIKGIENTTFQIVREGMREAVKRGTTQGLNMSSISIAAKTGTAELGTAKKNVNSWVLGFFPYEDPKYAFTVVMEKGPVTNLFGGTYVMRRVFDWMSVTTPEYFK
jgi:penicillin-binding protein 2